MSGIRPLTVAHRGDSAHQPENTLPALAAAIAAKADAVEFDVRLSRDGVPVVQHDADLHRFGGTRKLVRRHSAKELATADVGSWFASASSGVGVPSLAEWIAATPAHLGLCLELKPDRGDNGALVRATLRVLRRTRAIQRTWLLCFQPSPLHLAHRLEPSLRLVRNIERPPRDVASWLRRQPPLVAVDANIELLTPTAAAALHQAGLAVWCWTCTTTAHLRRAQQCRCSAVIANDPAWCRKNLARS